MCFFHFLLFGSILLSAFSTAHGLNVGEECDTIGMPMVKINDSSQAYTLWQGHAASKNQLFVIPSCSGDISTSPVRLTETENKISQEHIVINNKGEAVVSWCESDKKETTLFSSFMRKNNEWSDPQILAKGKTVHFTSLAMNNSSEVVAVWERRKDLDSRIELSHCILGKPWETPREISVKGARVNAVSVALNDASQMIIVWKEMLPSSERIQAVYFNARQPSEKLILHEKEKCRLIHPQIAINSRGEALAIWEKVEGWRRSLHAAFINAAGIIGEPVALSSSKENAMEAHLSFNDQSEAIVAWLSISDNKPCIRVSTHLPKGSWTPSIQISDDGKNVIEPKVVLNNHKQACIVWRQIDFPHPLIQAAVSIVGKKWSHPITLSAKNESAMYPSIAWNDQSQGVLAWKGKKNKAEYVSIKPLFWSIDEEATPPHSIALTSLSKQPVQEHLQITETIPATTHEQQVPPKSKEMNAQPSTIRHKRNAQKKARKWLIEVRAGIFYPQSELMRDLFSHVLPNFQLLFDRAIRKKLSLAGSIDYIWKRGHSIGNSDRTTVELMPLTLQVRYHWLKKGRHDWYVGAGPRYFILRTSTSSSSVKGVVRGEGLGGYVETGMLYRVFKNYHLDAFVGYSFKRMYFPSPKTNIEGNSPELGGFHAGVGFGYKF